jgi:hypothetical protein
MSVLYTTGVNCRQPSRRKKAKQLARGKIIINPCHSLSGPVYGEYLNPSDVQFLAAYMDIPGSISSPIEVSTRSVRIEASQTYIHQSSRQPYP